MVWSIFSTTQNPSNWWISDFTHNGYMIVPRFRNISLPFAMIVITTLRVLGIFIFVTIIFLMLKIRPKRLIIWLFHSVICHHVTIYEYHRAIRDVKYHIFEGRYHNAKNNSCWLFNLHWIMATVSHNHDIWNWIQNPSVFSWVHSATKYRWSFLILSCVIIGLLSIVFER